MFLFYIIGMTYNHGGINKNKHASFICFILLFVFFGFRDLPILNDTAHYYVSYQNSVDNKPSSVFDVNLLDRFGIGYQAFVNFLIRFVSSNPFTIVWFSSLLFSLFFAYGLRKYTSNIGLLCFLLLTSGITLLFYSAIRQSIATIIFFIAYSLLQKKRYFWYFVLSIIAYTFHNSAIILFLPFVLSFLRFNKINLIICTVFTIFAISLMGQLIDFLGFSDTTYLDVNNQRETFPLANLIYIIIYLFIFIFCYNVGHKFKIPRPDDMIIWMSVCSILIAISAMPLGIVGRFGMYFSVFNYIMLVYYIEGIPFRYRKRYLVPIVVLFMVKMTVELLLRPEWNHLVPYSFYDFFAPYHQTDFGY